MGEHSLALMDVCVGVCVDGDICRRYMCGFVCRRNSGGWVFCCVGGCGGWDTSGTINVLPL